MLAAKKLFLRYRLRHAFIFISFLVVILMLFLNWVRLSSSSRKCFVSVNGRAYNNKLLEDVLLSKKKPTPGRSIFFHETSCFPSRPAELTPREACAVESAALANPNLDVFVLFASPRLLANTSVSPIMEAILSYPNVHLRNLNLWTYASNTPIYDWLKDGKLFESKYTLSHTSDFLRFLTLWRWGGTYLDLDVIVRKSLEKIPPNFAGAESERFVAAGVMNFDHDGFGHQISDLCLSDFQTNFDGNEWGQNGPGVITRVLQEVCRTKSPLLMTRERCFGFKVYPKEAFYAIRWWNWNHFFDKEHLQETLKATNDSIIVHVWNRHSSAKVVPVGSAGAYVKLAEKYCPKVLSSCGLYF